MSFIMAQSALRCSLFDTFGSAKRDCCWAGIADFSFFIVSGLRLSVASTFAGLLTMLFSFLHIGEVVRTREAEGCVFLERGLNLFRDLCD